MLSLADVNKLRCDFVLKMQKYLSNRKKVLHPCNDEAVTAYLRYRGSLLTDECADGIECFSIPNTPPVTCEPVIPPSCSELTDLTYTQNFINCNYSTSVKTNGYVNKILLTPIVDSSTLNVNYSVVTTSAQPNCPTPVHTTNYSTTTQSASYLTNFDLSSVVDPTGFIEQITLSKYDNGTITPYTLSISPSVTSLLTGYLGTINPAHLLFSATDVNYAAALKKMICHAVDFYFSRQIDAVLTVSKLPTSLLITTKPKHTTGGIWAGIPKNDAKINVYANGVYTYIDGYSNSIQDSVAYASGTYTPVTSCTGTATAFNLSAYKPTLTMDFFNVGVSSPTLVNLASPVPTFPSYSCGTTVELKAYTDNTVISYEWKNPSNTVFSTAKQAYTIPVSGTYTLTVVTSCGTVIKTFELIADT